MEEPESTKLLRLVRPERRVRRFRLDVVDGEDVGLSATSEGEDFSIGSAPGNRLELRDRAVSRHHCVIESGSSRGFLLRDLDSTNGTFVEGFRIESVFLRDGAKVRFGRTTATFSVLEGTIRQELSTESALGAVLGGSEAMRRLFAVLRKVAGSDATVLLQGETGTGKTALARAVHDSSPRVEGPFVVVDCATIPPTLIESELFGHAKGAFTGADGQRAGAIEQADGGTLFLDEIGELPIDMQPKLLRAIEDHTVRPVGATETVTVDFRVVAATNRELRQEVNRGAFRSDLYYRLNTVKLSVPPLRKRREDIPLLVRHFADGFGATHQEQEFVEHMIETWKKRDWPGNVRELRSAVERALLLGPVGQVVNPSVPPRPDSSLPPQPPIPGPPGPPKMPQHDFSIPFREAKSSAVGEWERSYLAALLEKHGGNLSRAAREVEMDRNYLRELGKRHELV